jgi:hypothetical protein
VESKEIGDLTALEILDLNAFASAELIGLGIGRADARLLARHPLGLYGHPA